MKTILDTLTAISVCLVIAHFLLKVLHTRKRKELMEILAPEVRERLLQEWRDRQQLCNDIHRVFSSPSHLAYVQNIREKSLRELKEMEEIRG